MTALASGDVLLRPWRPGDAASIESICGDPEVSAWDRIAWTRDRAELDDQVSGARG